MGERVTPRTGGGDVNKSPRSGAKSAPSDAPAPRAGITPRAPGGKSAHTEAPAVRGGITIPKNGHRDTPTSVKMDEKVDPVQPPGPDRSRR